MTMSNKGSNSYGNTLGDYYNPMLAVTTHDMVPQDEIADILNYDNSAQNIPVVSKRQRKESLSSTEHIPQRK